MREFAILLSVILMALGSLLAIVSINAEGFPMLRDAMLALCCYMMALIVLRVYEVANS